MPSKNRKKKNPPSVVSVAPLYSEDIGLDGLKKKRFSVPNEIHQLPVDDQEQRKRQKRMQRFVEHNQKNSEVNESSIDGALKTSRTYTTKIKTAKASGNNNQFVGRSTALEKPYMRLTAAPKAEDVRPLPVLRKSLAHVKAHYIQNEDFDFANEQLKSIRQDITVQHLRNDFVLEVYETHSRILLEHGDLNEFNQCQTMIQSLTSPSHSSVDWGSSLENKSIRDRDSYDNASDTKNPLLMQSAEAADEFQAYSLLYDLVQNSWSDLKIHILSTKTRMHIGHSTGDGSIESTKSNRTPPITRGSSVRHALSVVKAIVHDDYLAFFRLYDSAPHMSAYLMDFLVRRVRNVAYARIVAAYRPTISTEGLREALSFRDFEETRQFLKAKGAVFLTDKGGHPPFWIDCKATYAVHLNRAK